MIRSTLKLILKSEVCCTIGFYELEFSLCLTWLGMPGCGGRGWIEKSSKKQQIVMGMPLYG